MTGQNEVLRDDSYFHWEFATRMTLARKDLRQRVMVKPDEEGRGVDRNSLEWKAADMRALVTIITLLLGTPYQTMIRDASSASEAWEILKSFLCGRTYTTASRCDDS